MVSEEILGGRYRLVTLLGEGGTSQVWSAHDEVLGRDVAVKLLATHLLDQHGLVERLRVEARAVARLHHPHVVTVYDFGELPRPAGRPVPYVVMELVAGWSLAAALRDGPLPWQDAVRYAAQIARALAAAHARGIVHRDVKPDNVMLTDEGAKLVDFGISAIIGEADIGPDGELLGTPAYLAPERLDTGPVRAACDVYGLGLVIYKSLTGQLPWRCEGMTELITAHRRRAPAPLPVLPGLPAEVAELCRRCLAKRPADRPTSEEAARVLAAAAGMPAGMSAWASAAGAVSRAVDRSAPTLRAISGRIAAPTVAGVGTGVHPPSRRRVLAVGALAVALGGLLMAARTAAEDGPPVEPAAAGGDPVPPCEVRYDVRSDSGSEFAAGLVLTNTGTAPIEAWRLDFAFPADQRVVRSSAGVWQQSGSTVVVEGGRAANLPAGESMELEFEGTYGDGNPLPTAFRLNGSDCAELLTASAHTVVPVDPGSVANQQQQQLTERPGGPPAPETRPSNNDNQGQGGSGRGNRGGSADTGGDEDAGDDGTGDDGTGDDGTGGEDDEDDGTGDDGTGEDGSGGDDDGGVVGGG